MSRIPRLIALLGGLGCVTGAGLAFPLPALAQAAGAGAEDRVNQVIVYGDDPCPASTSPDEITVCARKTESERYRIPAPLRDSTSPENRSWTDKVMAYETVGRSGTNSCSPVGAGGFTGCTQQLVKQAYAEKAQSSDVHFSELIAAERAKRLSTIDADAAATQARVEQAERDYTARQGSMAADDASTARTAPATPAAPTATPASDRAAAAAPPEGN